MLGSEAELQDRIRLEGRGQLSTVQPIVMALPSVATGSKDRTGRSGATVDMRQLDV